MSGGHFGDCGYDYYKVSQFADELEEEVRNNFEKDEYGYAYEYPAEVCEYLLEQVPKMRKMAEIMRHIDYLYSGDHGSDSFMGIVKEVEKKYNDPLQQILNDPDDNLNQKIADALRESVEIWDEK
jgi:hypothetical protein